MNNIPLASLLTTFINLKTLIIIYFFIKKHYFIYEKYIIFYFLNTLQLKRGLSFNILILA